MNKKNNYIKLNKYFLIVVVFLFAIIITKLIYIAVSPIVDGKDLKAFSRSIVQDTQVIRANRGTIYDVNGEALAQNASSYKVIGFLAESRTTDLTNPQHIIDKAGTARALGEILGISEEYLISRFNEDAYQVELGPKAKDITELTRQKIEALDLPGIGFVPTVKRDYPYGDFASYIIGYARKNETDEEITGEMGLEQKYNEELKGKDGSITYQKDAYGYKMAKSLDTVVEQVDGYDIYLTLDSNIQMYLENAITEYEKYGLEWGTITIADAKTGAIVGSAASPSFNPNVLEIKTWDNPLTSFTYEPGSTMKIFSFMAAIENGKYNGEELYQSGNIMVDGFKISDWNTYGWGKIPYDVGFTYSSNTAAVKLAQDLGRDKLVDFYEKLGFGSKTGFELPNEYDGEIELVYASELASASFGQGITTTPIQTIQALTSITNKGTTLKPYIVSKIVNSVTGEVIYEGTRTEVNKVASEETVKKIMDLMDETVNGADNAVTGKRYHTDVLTLIGKTGTAQFTLPNGKYSSGTYDSIRSFAGIFPKDDPQYIIYLSLKRYPASAEEMGKIASSVVESIAKYKNIEDRSSDIDSEKIVKINNYLNKSKDDIVSELEACGLSPIVIGNGEVIIKQYPLKDTSIISGSKVFLLTNGNEYIMPQAYGWNSSEIISFAKLINLSYTIDGVYGRVKALSILPNTVIDLSETLSITLDSRSEV